MQFVINLYSAVVPSAVVVINCDIFHKQQYRMESFELCLAISNWKLSLVVLSEKLNSYEVRYLNCLQDTQLCILLEILCLVQGIFDELIVW